MRLRDSQASLVRKNAKNPGDSKENNSYILKEYSQFIIKLKSMCLDSLFPGASPPRRSFALGILALYKDMGLWTDFDSNCAKVSLLMLQI